MPRSKAVGQEAMKEQEGSVAGRKQTKEGSLVAMLTLLNERLVVTEEGVGVWCGGTQVAAVE